MRPQTDQNKVLLTEKLSIVLCLAFAVALLQRMLTILQTIDSNVLSFRKLGVIVFGCWTLLRFKECMIKTLLDESIQVSTLCRSASQPLHMQSDPHSITADITI